MSRKRLIVALMALAAAALVAVNLLVEPSGAPEAAAAPVVRPDPPAAVASCNLPSPSPVDVRAGLARTIAALERAVDDGLVRGAVVGVRHDGEASVTGVGRMAGGDAAAPAGDTVFEIGSISKVFTALLAQAQADAGRLDWDRSIAAYLPDARFASEAVASITPRELATHTSGLPRLPDNLDPADGLDPYADYDRARLLAFLAAHVPEAPVREHAYSNLGGGLLGLVAAGAAGVEYAAALERDVLDPLGLRDTGVGVAERPSGRVAAGFSHGADMPNWTFDALAGLGAMSSTADDLLRFVAANFEPDALGGALAAVRELQGDGPTGLGWQVRVPPGGDPVCWHNGVTGGYASFLGVRPADGTGVVILATSTDGDLVTELGLAHFGAPPASDAMDPGPYLGAYRLDEQTVLTVRERGGRLFGQETGRGAVRLRPAAEERAFAYGSPNVRILFGEPVAGRAESLTFVRFGRRTTAPRVSDDQGVPVHAAIDAAPATLAEVAGRYELPRPWFGRLLGQPPAVLTVEARGAQLFARLTGQFSLPVFMHAPDRFFYRAVDAELHFQRDEDGTVDAVVLQQRGRIRARRIEQAPGRNRTGEHEGGD